ncbi:MAG: hypothetical protein H7312_06865 [Tardiphaga sp.]|nr:hypothetical protein [Tardiphaga sp.]
MKKFALGFAAAVALGLVAFAVPASAATPTPQGISTSTDISAARYGARRKSVRRGRVCSMRTVVRRGPMGRRIVTKTRVCR